MDTSKQFPPNVWHDIAGRLPKAERLHLTGTCRRLNTLRTKPELWTDLSPSFPMTPGTWYALNHRIISQIQTTQPAKADSVPFPTGHSHTFFLANGNPHVAFLSDHGPKRALHVTDLKTGQSQRTELNMSGALELIVIKGAAPFFLIKTPSQTSAYTHRLRNLGAIPLSTPTHNIKRCGRPLQTQDYTFIVDVSTGRRKWTYKKGRWACTTLPQGSRDWTSSESLLIGNHTYCHQVVNFVSARLKAEHDWTRTYRLPSELATTHPRPRMMGEALPVGQHHVILMQSAPTNPDQEAELFWLRLGDSPDATVIAKYPSPHPLLGVAMDEEGLTTWSLKQEGNQCEAVSRLVPADQTFIAPAIYNPDLYTPQPPSPPSTPEPTPQPTLFSFWLMSSAILTVAATYRAARCLSLPTTCATVGIGISTWGLIKDQAADTQVLTALIPVAAFIALRHWDKGELYDLVGDVAGCGTLIGWPLTLHLAKRELWVK